MNEKWFLMSVDEIEKKLKTNAASGLSLKAARSRASLHKKDSPFFTVKKKRADKMLLELFSDIFLVLLTLLAIFSLFFEGDVVIGSAILTVIIINIALSFFIYYRDRRTVESMSDFFSPTARVIRGGKLYIVDYRDLAEGDVIILEKGDILGCDARLVYSDALTVRMKVDKKTEKLLEKYAGGAIREDELYAENMVNMVHAGSIVESGSGRAIVTALGQHTYLGAMTGGITELPSRELPRGLAHLKKECSKMSMIMLVLTLPFCIFSVIFGNFPGGNVLLSEAVLLALSIGASAMLMRSDNLFITFYVRFIRRLAISENPCIVRSVDTLDKLVDVDYLFLLDGSIATDGILHFDTLMTADGETDNLKHLGQTAAALSELIAVYSRARSSAPSVGVRGNSDIDIGISEFLKKSTVDTEALKIRCNINSYLPGIDREARDVVIYSDKGVKYEMSVSMSDASFDECVYIMVAGVQKTLSKDGRDSLKTSFAKYISMGRMPVIFSVDTGNGRCFVGMMIFHEGADLALAKAISSLRRSGMNIVSFSNCIGRRNVPEIPDILRQGNRVYASDMRRQGRDITYDFGSYDEYCGFGEKDIALLARYVKAQGNGLAVLGFTDYAEEAAESADVFISCAPVRTGVFGHLEEEIRSLEVPGEQSSASCTQTVKSEADILLMRPKNSKGGLEPLANAMTYCRVAYRNLSNFMRYFVLAQIMRIVAIALPMLFGQTAADARQVLLLGFLPDLAALMIFASDMRKGNLQRKTSDTELMKFNFVGIVKNNLQLTFPALIGSVLCLILPNLISLINIFDNYLYKSEFTFMSLALLQFCLLVCVYAGGILNGVILKRIFTNKIFIVELSCTALLLLLCFLTPVGRLFGLLKNPTIYFILSFVPSIAFIVSYFVITFPKAKMGKKENVQKYRSKM